MTTKGKTWNDRVRFYKDNAGEFRWTKRSGGNWKVVGAASEGYSSEHTNFVNFNREYGSPDLRFYNAGSDWVIYEVLP